MTVSREAPSGGGFEVRRGLPAGSGPGGRARVCIATSDLRGPIRNGGVGTACAALAECLAAAGHDVTVLYAGDFEAGSAATWQAHYARRGVAVHVPGPDDVPLLGTAHLAASYRLYRWLERQPAFDVVHVPEINGLGFYALQAKRLGLAFRSTCFCVGLHSPTLWHRSENREPVLSEEVLLLEFLERESVARADVVISPTRYLLDWARGWGYQVPAQVYVQPNVPEIIPSEEPIEVERRVSEIVFFGRLESRKGIELFCDALDLLERRGDLGSVPVTFLGKPGRVGDEDGVTYARRRTAALGTSVRIESALGQAEAVAWLRSRQALAVMPSLADNMPYAVLECLTAGIPFVAAASGGIPEMIAAEDRPRVLVHADATALANRMAAALGGAACVARPADDPIAVRQAWIDWHRALAGTSRADAARAPGGNPLVSVCIATRNRPALLEQALETVRRQTYPSIEVIVVDDASDSEDALTYLDRLETECGARGWRLLRRSSRGYPSAARNMAAAAAQGEYLLFMDDDNLARPDEVEVFVRSAQVSNVPILTCVLDQFRADPGEAAGAPVFRWLPAGPALASGLFVNRFGDTNMLVRREVFAELGGFDERPEANFAEDWEFLARAALAGTDVAVVPEPLCLYRVWDGANGYGRAAAESLPGRIGAYLQPHPPAVKALLMLAAGQYHQPGRDSLAEQVAHRAACNLEVRFERAAPWLRIGPDDPDAVHPVQQLEVQGTGNGIRLRSLGNDPIARLPKGGPAGQHGIVRIDASVDRPTILQMFWETRDQPEPCEANSALTGFGRGRHVRFLEIPAAAHIGRLRLDPGFAPGDLVLHSLEIRYEPSAASPSSRFGGLTAPAARHRLVAAWRRLRRRQMPDASR